MEQERIRQPSSAAFAEAERVAALHPDQQRNHPRAVKADHARLTHVNTYGALPDYYIDQPFVCRDCGGPQIWRAEDQKWYYEEAKRHTDARAVRCRACRVARRDRSIEQGE